MQILNTIIICLAIIIAIIAVSSIRLRKHPSGSSYTVETEQGKVLTILTYVLIDILVLLIWTKFFLEIHDALGLVVSFCCLLYVLNNLYKNQRVGLKELKKENLNDFDSISR